jgi:membrane protein implicated in regulation of membrane protease activity
MGIPYFYSIFRQVWHEFTYWGNKAFVKFMQTPLPKLLLLVVAVLILFVILPLTILLFITFVLLKFVLTMLIWAAQRNRKEPRQIK